MEEKQKKKSPNLVLAVICIVLITVFVVGGIVFVVKYKQDNKTTPIHNEEQKGEQEEETTIDSSLDFDELIDEVAKKYDYDEELVGILKRCVPAMIEGKNEEEVQLLKDTLLKVRIYLFDSIPQEKDINEILDKELAGNYDNLNIEEGEDERGEYSKDIAPAAYLCTPIFDEDMNAVGKVDFLYVSKIGNINSNTAEYYGTNIDLSMFIHELGHAWASQKDVIIPEGDGFIFRRGMARSKYEVDKENRSFKEVSVEGLYLEEAMDSIEEEKAMLRLFGINDLSEIPGYSKSAYNGEMTELVKYFNEQLGESALLKLRILNDSTEVDQLEDLFKSTTYYTKYRLMDELYEQKEKLLYGFEESTKISDETKENIKKDIDEYKEVFMNRDENQTLLEVLDNALECSFTLNSIMNPYVYNLNGDFSLRDDDIKSIYEKMRSSYFVDITYAITGIAQMKNN